MTYAAILAQAALFLWFFGCIRTYRIGKALLVEGMGVKSAEFVMLCLFTATAALSWLFPAWGCWPLLGVLIFWFTVQFFCHWYYTIFGATPKKLSGKTCQGEKRTKSCGRTRDLKQDPVRLDEQSK